MVKVDNRKTMRLVTKRFMKMNRKRNVIAVIAIILTALLFTSLFVGSQSLILSKRAVDIEQSMDSSHAGVQNMTKEQAKKALQTVKSSNEVSRFGQAVFLGSGMNPQFQFSTEVRYADKNMAESFNCLPTTGRLPKKKNEIAVSSLILDKLGVPHKLGQKIRITWEKDGTDHTTQTDEFVVSGYWKGDKAVIAQLLFVSEQYAKENTATATQKDTENGIYNGTYEVCVWYSNLWNLQKKTGQLNRQAGFTKAYTKFETNPAYDLMEEDSFPFASVVFMLLFIVLAGYLIIYNVFSISVRTDIRAYGLLKNIGMTGKQLKKIVRMQALRLSVIGIPIGLLAGYLASLWMAPVLNADSEITTQKVTKTTVIVSADPVIFIIAAVFTLLTVYLSCLQSCHMVQKLSPVEALRLSEDDSPRRRRRKSNDFSTNWCGMAMQNMFRQWKKGLIVMLSIALSMLVVNAIVMLVTGCDFDSYKNIFLVSDFKISQMTDLATTADFEGVSPDVQKILNGCPYGEEPGYVYYSPETHKAEERLQNVLAKVADACKSSWNDYEKKNWRNIQKTGNIKVHLMGLNKVAFSKLEWQGKKCSWSEFQSGKYVITDYSPYLEISDAYYQSGDSFTMKYSSGDTKTYTVAGVAAIPYAIDYPYVDEMYITVFVPDEEFKAHTGRKGAMYGIMDAKKGQKKQVQNYLEKTLLTENDMMKVESILDMEESFQRNVSKYYSIGFFLVLVLLCISIMNFFNTTATTVLTRKKELTLLEAVGMPQKQIIKMLIMEGCFFFLGAFVIAAVLSLTVVKNIMQNTVAQAFYFRLQPTFIPSLCMLPLFLIVAIVIPYNQYNKLEQESIVERIRNE